MPLRERRLLAPHIIPQRLRTPLPQLPVQQHAPLRRSKTRNLHPRQLHLPRRHNPADGCHYLVQRLPVAVSVLIQHPLPHREKHLHVPLPELPTLLRLHHRVMPLLRQSLLHHRHRSHVHRQTLAHALAAGTTHPATPLIMVSHPQRSPPHPAVIPRHGGIHQRVPLPHRVQSPQRPLPVACQRRLLPLALVTYLAVNLRLRQPQRVRAGIQIRTEHHLLPAPHILRSARHTETHRNMPPLLLHLHLFHLDLRRQITCHCQRPQQQYHTPVSHNP